jgi:uncharacterized protein (DUF2267 family)
MKPSTIDLDKFAHDAHQYINSLAEDLGHPHEKQRVMIIWRAVMHTIRDRIHIAESLDLISSLPMILKGMYTLGWTYSETPPYDYKTIDEMKTQVKALQNQYGEDDFNWEKPTEEIIATVLNSLERYLSQDHMEHIRAQLPQEVKPLV